MNFDDIKNKTLAECPDLTIEQMYQIFKQRYEEEQNEIFANQWGKDDAHRK